MFLRAVLLCLITLLILSLVPSPTPQRELPDVAHNEIVPETKQKRTHHATRGRHSEPRKVIASWYGPGFHGKTMANGQRYDMHDPHVVAHKTLPFGTKVKFTNPETGTSIVAVVRDRGPYKPGRDFDLSYGAAQKLGTVERGVAPLRAQIIRDI